MKSMTVDINEIFYFMGLTQSDGGFFVLLRGTDPVLKPVFKVASSTNTNTLSEFKDFLGKIGVYAGSEEGVLMDPEIEEPGRAPSLRVQSATSIQKIISVYREAWFNVTGCDTPLLANKQRDLMLLSSICSINTFSKEEKIDLRYTFHKEKYTDPDFPCNVQTKSRAQREAEFNIVGKSSGAAKNFVENIEKTLKSPNPMEISCHFWLGLLDGDGGFHVTCRPRMNDNRTYISYLEFSIYVTLTLELASESVFRDFEKAVGLSPLRIIDLRETTGKNGLQIQIRNAEEVKKLMKFIDNCGGLREGLRGNAKKNDYEVMKETQNLREQRKFFL